MLRQRQISKLPFEPFQFNERSCRRRTKSPRFSSIRVKAAGVIDEESWIAKNQSRVRIAPLIAGGLGIISVVLNRALSGAVGLDASSTESRTDVIVIALSAVLLMTGLQWLALKPVVKESVDLNGIEIDFMKPELSESASQELQWAWSSLKSGTRCRSLVVFHKGAAIAHFGVANRDSDASASQPGPICVKAMQEERGNYLANLTLYPGRFEFLEYLPSNMQGVVIQPIGQEGVVIAGTDTQRGFSRLDQAWIALIADKLSNTLGY